MVEEKDFCVERKVKVGQVKSHRIYSSVFACQQRERGGIRSICGRGRITRWLGGVVSSEMVRVRGR